MTVNYVRYNYDPNYIPVNNGVRYDASRDNDVNDQHCVENGRRK